MISVFTSVFSSLILTLTFFFSERLSDHVALSLSKRKAVIDSEFIHRYTMKYISKGLQRLNAGGCRHSWTGYFLKVNSLRFSHRLMLMLMLVSQQDGWFQKEGGRKAI